MAYYFFVKDFEEGKAAERFIVEHLTERYKAMSLQEWSISEIPKERQAFGDIECRVVGPGGNPNIDEHFHIEVKFDRMAGSTGNLCFEVANRKGDLTGIASTKAESIVYIVPNGDSSVKLYWFNTSELRDYLYDERNLSKIRNVKGGDRKAYTLLLVSIENILKDKVAFEVETVDAQLPV